MRISSTTLSNCFCFRSVVEERICVACAEARTARSPFRSPHQACPGPAAQARDGAHRKGEPPGRSAGRPGPSRTGPSAVSQIEKVKAQPEEYEKDYENRDDDPSGSPVR